MPASQPTRYLARLLQLLLVVSVNYTAWAQALTAKQKEQAYDFVGYYFRAETKNCQLDAQLLPVVSPYADHFDLKKALSARYLTQNQFATAVRVDTLLTEADFEEMRAQLAAWQTTRRWPVKQLRAAGVMVLTHDRRTQQQLFPSFVTYQVFPPLFSRNGELALLYVENHCGLDCAGGQINLLRRQPGGTWKQVLGVPIFVS